MPILVPAPAPAVDLIDGDLAQGDLLKELVLPFMRTDGKLQAVKESLGLVVTRDCQAIHGRFIVVAVVKETVSSLPKKPGDVSATEYFETIKRTFDGLRDGTSPDGFYLGTRPDGSTARLAASLDLLTLVEVPSDAANAEERRNWILKHRVATLSDSFKRSLPVRLFGSYAKIGHDDEGWLCTPDLELLIEVAAACRGELQSELSSKRAEAMRVGTALHEGGTKTNPEKKLDAVSTLHGRLVAERERRGR